jgi:hypothetical protein
VHVPQVTTSVFDLIVYASSMAISVYLRKVHVNSTI